MDGWMGVMVRTATMMADDCLERRKKEKRQEEKKKKTGRANEIWIEASPDSTVPGQW